MRDMVTKNVPMHDTDRVMSQMIGICNLGYGVIAMSSGSPHALVTLLRSSYSPIIGPFSVWLYKANSEFVSFSLEISSSRIVRILKLGR